jgi:hypothetical protein
MIRKPHVYVCRNGHKRESRAEWVQYGLASPPDLLPCNGVKADGSKCTLPGMIVR